MIPTRLPKNIFALFSLLLALSLVFGLASPALAQAGLVLSVHKSFGYSSGSQIRGTFLARVRGPQDLASVTFWIDGQVLGEITSPPFDLSFKTTDFPSGWHELTAVGKTTAGLTLSSEPRRFEFVTPGQEAAGIQRVILPLGGVIGGIMLLMLAVQFLGGRGGKKSSIPLGASRSYGVIGGTVCPKCKRPFPLHWWAVNISFAGKLDRCEHCGKWSAVRRQPADVLARAEAAELEMGKPQVPVSEQSEAEKLKQRLDSSRYMNE